MSILNKLINKKNKTLWDKIENKKSISITIWDKAYSEVYSNEKIIEIRLKQLDTNHFNHELCHIYLKQLIGPLSIPININKPINLDRFISRDFCIQIGNFLEHVIMHDLFIEIGGEKNKFTDDYNEKKGNNYHNIIKNLTKLNIEDYLGNLFSILCDCNPDIDYTIERDAYEKISADVYNASKNLIKEIKFLGLTKQLEDFEIINDTLIINKTHNNIASEFWGIVNNAVS